MARKGGGLFSVSTILASFFGAAMIAGAFAYFNYKFSEYKFLNFTEWTFYKEKSLFTPSANRYIVIFYSSNVPGTMAYLKKVHASDYPIIAIDYYQQTAPSSDGIEFLKAGTNTTLKFIQRFNIYHTPSVFIIKKTNNMLYKQDSMIRQLDTLEKLSVTIDGL